MRKLLDALPDLQPEADRRREVNAEEARKYARKYALICSDAAKQAMEGGRIDEAAYMVGEGLAAFAASLPPMNDGMIPLPSDTEAYAAWAAKMQAEMNGGGK